MFSLKHSFPARSIAFLFLAICCALLSLPAAARGAEPESTEWITRDASGHARVHLYFFWSETCPHCLKARPFVSGLASQYPWLRVHALELTQNPENARQYVELARQLGREARAVPAFLFCRNLVLGFDGPETTGESLRRQLLACRQNAETGVGPALGAEPEALPALPWIGELEPDRYSLPVLTLILAGMDAFNPCAFFVLLFLLSLMVHAQSRWRMAFIGAVFVTVSGLLYFLFMAGWLNLFLWLGELRGVTLTAGVLALVLAGINIKDYFFFGRGISLSIPDRARPGLFDRMRGLAQASRLPSMTLGTVLLALAANTYELLCTAGFPMVYTRILTFRAGPQTGYYLYLLLYNVIYVIPLALIVILFTVTLGSRKLQEMEGRLLKLLSGWMMLGLGILLLVWPEGLHHLVTGAALLAAALFLTTLTHWLARKAGP